MKPSKVSKRVFSSNVINSSSSAVLALKSPIRQIFLEFQELLSANDIICLVESKTDDTDEILLPGYIFKMKNRKTFACPI
jgi:hypothetical protein